MDKRYQVFVSSTYEDLKEERQEIIQALLELDCIPAGMELFPAADEDQWTLIKKVIDDCDYYIVIVGGRYGSLSSSGISYTQMEYEYAVMQNKPVIGFIHKNPESIPAGKTERTEEGRAKLDSFRKLVQKKMCKHWSTRAELGSAVSRSVVKLIKNHPAVGWVRGDLVPSESTSQEILGLKKRNEELEKSLEEARFEAPRGTEMLSQGYEEFIINFQYDDRDKDYKTIELYAGTHATNWNAIFSLLSPYMINEASENSLKRALEKYLIEVTEIKERYGKRFNEYRLDIKGDDFQTIKVQLRALGLIKRSIKQRSVKDTETYWTLTPYGDNVMTRLRAIKRASE
jgi:hypothetical protein